MAEVVNDITQLLNSISRDLDVMMRDLCHQVPYRSVTAARSECRGLQYVYRDDCQSQQLPARTGCSNLQQYQQCPSGVGRVDLQPSQQIPTNNNCLGQRKRQMGLLQQHSSVPATSSGDVTSSTSSDEYYSLDENSDIFPDSPHSCSPDVFDSHNDDANFPSNGTAVSSYEGQQHRAEGNQPFPALGIEQPINITAYDRILKTQPIWHLASLSRGGAVHILHTRPQGVFVVRQSSKAGCLALSVRVGERPSIEHYIIEQASRGVRLENSYHYFKELLLLITHYTQNLDELPVKLQLPLVLQAANSHHKLNSYALMGQGFWSSVFSDKCLLHYHSTEVTAPTPRQQPRTCSTPVQTTTATAEVTKHSRSVQSTSQHHKQQTNRQAKQQTVKKNTSESKVSNVKRLSLSQINHSVTSPFNEVAVSDDKHDYVNIPHINGANLFRPIEAASSDVSFTASSSAQRSRLVEESGKCKKLGSKDKRIEEATSMQDVERHIEREIESLENLEKDLYEAENSSKTNNDLQLRTNKKTKQTVIQNGTKHLSLIPTYKTNEPAVFTFDFVMPTKDNEARVLGQHLSVPGNSMPESSPQSAKTQYSSPAYAEPFDTLIGKVEGVTETTNTINVNTFLRQKLMESSRTKTERIVTKSEQGTSPLHGTYTKDTRRSTGLGTSASYCHPKQSSPVRDIEVSKSDTYIGGAFDSRVTSDPRYRVSLEEIPLSPQTLHNKPLRQAKSAERSFSLKSLERSSLESEDRKYDIRAKSLPRDITEPRVHDKPPRGPASQRPELAPHQTNKPNNQSNSFEENFFHASQDDQMPHKDIKSPSIFRQFPLPDKTSSKRSSFSDGSTLEGILSSLSPELAVEPINALTEKNVNRISEYDNFCRGFCNHESGGAMSSHRVVSSAGTHYSQPWDNSLWYNLLQKSTQARKDRGSLLADSDRYSQLGSDIACSTFEWHKKPDRDSATETTPQPPQFFDEFIHPVMYDGAGGYGGSDGGRVFGDNAVQTMVESTLSDDEGVSVEDVVLQTRNTRLFTAQHSAHMEYYNTNPPGVKLENYVSGLAEKAETMFGSHVDRFVKCTLEGSESNPHTVLRNVRQFMNGIKNYLVQHGEKQLNDLIELESNRLGQHEFLNVDTIIETSLHKCVVKPVKSHIYKLFVAYYHNTGQLKELSESIEYARTKTPQELGIRACIQPPSGTSMEIIKDYLEKMQLSSSPRHKLENLLGATSTMVGSVQSRDRGSVSSQDTNVSMATDDLLPMLIYVLVHCGVVTAEIEADYMWGLLHPSVLAGEGGYYLTTFSSAIHLLKNLKVAMEATPGEVRFPSLGDLQGFMKIIIPEEKHNSIITKTLPVRPSMTTKEVCVMIAHRLRITNPQDYGLYILVLGYEDRLCDTSCPQQIKVQLQKERRQCVFAYKRNNAKFAWPVHFR